MRVIYIVYYNSESHKKYGFSIPSPTKPESTSSWNNSYLIGSPPLQNQYESNKCISLQDFKLSFAKDACQRALEKFKSIF